MWYSDPSLALPALWGTISFMALCMMMLVAKRGMKITAGIFGFVFGIFLLSAVFAFCFGFYLRHTEEVNAFIGRW